MSYQLEIDGLSVEVVRKKIKHLHLRVSLGGQVRVAAPMFVNKDSVRQAVLGKLNWIKRHRERLAAQPRPARREMVSGESHYFMGQPFLLQVVEQDRPAKVVLQDNASILLSVKPGASIQQRAKVLYDWYREQLRTMLPPLLEKWQMALGVTASGWGIKKMKTRWGTCNTRARRVWINLELAKKPIECLEYIVVHELLHLLERRHSERFNSLMDMYLPTWRSVRELLNSVPLFHDACLC